MGLSFGGVPCTLVVPFAALTGFADPAVRFGLRFRPAAPDEADLAEEEPEAAADSAPAEEKPAETPQVVSLDAFRRRKD